MMVCCMSGLVAALGWQAHLLHLGKLVAACACANPHEAIAAWTTLSEMDRVSFICSLGFHYALTCLEVR